jgi:hypothetical protein
MRPAVSLLVGMICAVFMCAGAVAQPTASGTVISGIVVDSITQQPLASATITVKETSKRTLTEADGAFSINIGTGLKTLVIGYTGYLAQRIAVGGKMEPLRIALIRKSDPLKDVVVTSDLNPAHRIIWLMQQHRREHDPLNILSYEYNAYTISELEGTNYLWKLAAGKAKVDTPVVQKRRRKYTEADSLQDLRDDSTTDLLKKNYIFVAESYTDKKYRQPRQVKETVLATKIAGIKNPMVAITAANFDYFGFYFDYPQVAERIYTSPLVAGSTSLYRFSLREVIPNGRDSTYVITYEPRAGKNFLGLKGTLYINSDRYAIEKVTAIPADDRTKALSFRLEQQYRRVDTRWFPYQLNFDTRQKDMKTDSVLFSWNTRTTLSNIQLDKNFPPSEFSDVAIEAPRGTGKLTEEEWKKLRPDTLPMRDRETYRAYQSMPSEILGFMNALNGITEALALQAIPLGKVDLPFQYLFSGVTPYEKFRPGLGAQTNLLFSNWFSIGGYAGYGLGDHAWKYGGNVFFTFNRRSHTELHFSFSQDLREPGTVPYFTDNETIYSTNTLRGLFTSRLDSIREWKVLFNSKVRPNLQLNAWLLNEERGPAGFDYGFDKSGGTAFEHRFQNTEVGIGFRFTTRETFERIGRAIVPNTPRRTKILMQLSKGLPDVVGGELDYTKLALVWLQRFSTKHFGETSFRLEAGKIWGDLPYSYLFNLAASGQQRGTLVNGLLVGNSFQTVAPYEFTASQTATLFLQQNFGNLLFRPKTASFRPELSLIQHISYGNITHPEYHSGIKLQAPVKGLYESGLQLENLYRFNLRFFYVGLGAGVYYRYGQYALPVPSDNWAFKFGIGISN